MFKPIRISVLLLALVAALAVSAGGSPQPAAAKSFLQVSAREFSFSLSRTSVPAGRVTIEFVNLGGDRHNLALRRRGDRSTIRIKTVNPGKRVSRTTGLHRGRYSLWCTIGDHRQRGMRATLRVK